MPKNGVDGSVWTKLAAKQGGSDAQSTLRPMVREMTEKELKKARYLVSRSLVEPVQSEHDRLRTPQKGAHCAYGWW